MKIRVKKVKVRIFIFVLEILIFQHPQQWHYKVCPSWSFTHTFSDTLFNYLCPRLCSPKRTECLELEGRCWGLISGTSPLIPPPFVRRKLKPRGGSLVCTSSTESEFKLYLSHSLHRIKLVLKTRGLSIFNNHYGPFKKGKWPWRKMP